MNLVGLIACSSRKLGRPAPAQDLYQGVLFKKAVSWVERFWTTEWAILSAKHGLVHRKQIVAPYNMTLNHMGSSDRVQWAACVRAQLLSSFPSNPTFIVVAGARYRAAILGLCWFCPVVGMRLGEQLRFLSSGMRWPIGIEGPS